jgi:hypothetical protein
VLAAIPQIYTRSAERYMDYDAARNVTWAFQTIYDELSGPKGGNPAVREKLAAIDKEVKLRLLDTDPKDSTFERIKKYDSGKFQGLLKELGAALGARGE